MTTFVGTQKNFMDAICSLIELDYAAAEAYSTAIKNISNPSRKAQLSMFMSDHHDHIVKLRELVLKHGGSPPSGANRLKQLITKGKVSIGILISDRAILQAMLDNERDTNQAYSRMHRRADKWEDAADIIKKGVEDEIKHKEWLEQEISDYP